jgi:diguanylate cyclase (GGDEF)-like protein
VAGGSCWLVDLSSDLRLAEVLDRTIENALRALPGREFAVLLMVDDDLRLVRHSGLRPSMRRRIERWSASDPALLAEPREDGPMRAQPLLVGARSLGMIVALTPESAPFGDAERATLTDFAEQAAIALRNAHLFQQLLERATRDALTGLANRRELDRMLARELERSSRYAEIFSVAMIDLDGFKDLNDRLGHAAGDAVLRKAAATIDAACRAADVGARLGGDEFVLILPQTNQFEAAALCERLRAQVETLGDISLSWGIAEYPTHGVDADQLMRAADAAMYASKPRVAGGERAGG